MSLHEIARSEAEYLRVALPAVIVSVDRTIIALSQPGAALPFVIECMGQNRFLIGYPPTTGGFPTQVTSQQRVELSQAEMRSRANACAVK
jgi:hypothetical protein